MQVISLKEITQESKFSNDFLQLPMNFLHTSLVIKRNYKDIKFIATRGRGGGGGRGAARREAAYELFGAKCGTYSSIYCTSFISYFSDLDLLLFLCCFIFV